MKPFDYILLSLLTVFLIIAIHQSTVYGVGASYWLYMLVMGIMFWLNIRLAKANEDDRKNAPTSIAKSNKKTKKTSKK